MAIYITCKKEWLETSWAKTKLGNIMVEANKKRIPCHIVFCRNELEKYKDEYLTSQSCIVIDANGGDEMEIMKEYEDLPIHIILFTHRFYSNLEKEVSYVMTDLTRSMHNILETLKQKGCKYPVLFGDNDKNKKSLRIKLFKELDYTNRKKVFSIGQKRFSEVVLSLLKYKEKIDAIICIDDFQAIRLMKIFDLIDPTWPNKICLISNTNTIISSLYLTPITSNTMGFEEGGKAIITIHDALKKNRDIEAMHIVLKSRIIERKTTNLINPEGMIFANYPKLEIDKIKEIITFGKKANLIELILQNADKLDLNIIISLLEKKNINDIAKDNYCSLSTIKYRIKNIKNVLKVNTNTELLDVLKAFLNKELLKEYSFKK